MTQPSDDAAESAECPLRALSIPHDAVISCRVVPPDSEAERRMGHQRFEFEISRRLSATSLLPEVPFRRVNLHFDSSGKAIGLNDFGMYDGGVRIVVAFMPSTGELEGFRTDVGSSGTIGDVGPDDEEPSQHALSPDELSQASALAQWLSFKRDGCE